jgi:hypothetical protein
LIKASRHSQNLPNFTKNKQHNITLFVELMNVAQDTSDLPAHGLYNEYMFKTIFYNA